MALHDTDKVSEDRSSFGPNSSDGLIDRMAHQTASSHYKPTTDTSTARLQQVGKTIIANDGIANKASFGYNPGLNLWGQFVAQDGIDVMTNTDPANLIFNSSQNVFKITKTINLSVTVASGTPVTGTAQQAHGLGLIPAFIAYVVDGGNYFAVPFSSSSLGFGVIGTIQVYSDIDNIYVAATPLTTPADPLFVRTYTVKIYVLQETAS